MANTSDGDLMVFTAASDCLLSFPVINRFYALPLVAERCGSQAAPMGQSVMTTLEAIALRHRGNGGDRNFCVNHRIPG